MVRWGNYTIYWHVTLGRDMGTLFCGNLTSHLNSNEEILLLKRGGGGGGGGGRACGWLGVRYWNQWGSMGSKTVKVMDLLFMLVYA